MSNIGIYVGTSPEAVRAVADTILRILNARVDQKTIRQALSILEKSTAAPSHTHLNNCNIDMGNSREQEQGTDE